MTGWNGLLRKEWMLMRYTFIAFIVVFVVIAVSSFAPLAVGGIFDLVEITNMFSYLQMYFGALLFIHSLHTDMKQPDIWLHSPASITQLLASKMLMALLLVGVSNLIWSGIGVVAYFIGGFEGVIPGWPNLLKVFLTATFAISASLPIWVIYRLLSLKIGWLAVIVVIIFFTLVSMVWGIIEVIWGEIGPDIGSLVYILVSFVLFAGGAILLEKKVRY
ncbi:hypothetical protein QTL97_06785 [Sporosarcina thermotolerans]|uniref:ABC transporter permease n=1 Tax=Sporosarcina thermotolerans TaxID=633404 RepID=A0AAW9A9Q0_9BACL|nr:hypothetical protein [Sporosarcina thermotolerans]MDW0116635.1 hypothetical protein [Sporosarcina thermotolerans]WHT48839.1 hypothetical protein QNH10_03690 [Sporosarcina thermotolerans]